MIGQTLGNYRIVEHVGAGGMGQVYRARDENLQRDVALKVIHGGSSDERASARFRREALALSRLNHANVATVHDFGTDQGVDYMVMELVDGPSLTDRMSDQPPTEDDLLRICGQVASGLSEAHAAGITHRDLKPGNIRLTKRGDAKVLDFGLALTNEPSSETEATVSITPESYAAGTLPYMSPEQLRGQEPGPASDVWSLGVIMYEMMAKARPFRGSTRFETSSAIMNEDAPPLPSSTSPELAAIIHKCLNKTADQRYANAGELKLALETLRMGSSSRASTPTPPVESSRPKAWLPLAALLGVAVAVFFLMRDDQGSPAPTESDSLVALPTTVFGGEEDRFLTDAIPHSMSTQLSSLPGLQMKVPPTSVEYMALGSDLDRAAHAYDVGAFLVSSVTTTSERLVLDVQLVDASTRTVLWGGDFESQRNDYLALIRRAAEAIRSQLTPASALAADSEGNSEAILALRQAEHHLLFFYTTAQPPEFEKAQAAFTRALELDPSLADAAAGLAQIEIASVNMGVDPVDALTRSQVWADRAIQLDPENSKAWQQLSGLQDMLPDGDPTKGLEYALKAAAFDPRNNYAHSVLANVLVRTSTRLGRAAYAEAPRLNPLDLASAAAAGGLAGLLGDREKSLHELDRVLRVEPEFAYAVLNRVVSLLLAGDPAAATEGIAKLDQYAAQNRLLPAFATFARHAFDYADAMSRQAAESATTERAWLMHQAQGEGDPYPFWERVTQAVALLLLQFGDREEALTVLARRAELGLTDPYDMLHRRGVTDLDDPRIEQIVATSRAAFESTLSQLEAARDRDELPDYLADELTGLRASLN